MTDRYQFWRDSLAGKKPPIVNEDPQPGFYRMKRGNDKVHVAVWPLGGSALDAGLGFKIGHEVVDARTGIEQWPWYAANPVPEHRYREVAEKGMKWWDADPTVTAMLDATKSVENAPKAPDDATKPPPDPIAEFREQIKTALAGLTIYAKIESDEKDVQALSLRNMLNELATDADKTREAEKAPYFKKAKEVDAKWQPLIKEARAGAGKIKDARDQWAEDKRQAAIEAQKRADEITEKHRRDVEWAEAGSEPAPSAPHIPASNLPPPSTQVRPTYGRASGTGTKIVVTEVDYDKMFEDLKKRPELWERFKEIMFEIAEKCAGKGIILGGVTTKEKANTR